MDNLAISTLDAIESAINRDEKGDALAIVQNARDAVTSGSELLSPVKRLRAELEAADVAIDGVDSFLHVCGFALRGQDCDVDRDVAVVLDEAWAKVREARDRIVTAIDLLPEVANG